MTLKYFEIENSSPLIEELFQLSFYEEDIPFKSTILPIGLTHLFYIGRGSQKIIVEKVETLLEGLMITGQYYRSYKFFTNSITSSIGISLHPTALHKLLNIDISKLKNRHVSLKQINEAHYNELLPIFENSKNSEQLVVKLNSFLLNIPLNINKNTEQIDLVISIIKEKDGLLNVLDIIDKISISQKTLETQFKRIVGLTPGKYIRLFRFLNLMRKYESKEIDIKDLIYMYNYYDHSHFTKDFKHFMKQSPKDYFKTDHAFLNEYLNK